MPIFDNPLQQNMNSWTNAMQPAPVVKKKPVNPGLPQDPPMAPPLGVTPHDPMMRTNTASMFPDLQAPATPAPMTMSQWPKTPMPGKAFAASSQGPATPNTPVQEFNVPVGPQPVRPENRPAPIGSAWSGFGRFGSSGGGGGSSMASGPGGAADNISAFYDRLGMPLNEVIGQAQADEGVAKNAWMQRTGDEATSRGMQQEMMAHQIQHAPQNEALNAIRELATTQLYNPTPEGHALMQHYIQQLAQGAGMPPQAPTAAGVAPGGQPPAAPATNDHPGIGGMFHALMRSGVPAAVGGAVAKLAPQLLGTTPLGRVASVLATLGSSFGADKLMNEVDPGGAGAEREHPIATLGGYGAGGYLGYRGFGKSGAQSSAPAGSNLADNPTEGGPTILNPTAQAEQAAFAGQNPAMGSRQMSPFGGQVQPGQTPVAPASRQLGMGDLGAQSSMPPKVQMSGDPQVEAALAQFKQTLPAATQPSAQAEQFSLPLQQQSQGTPGMMSTAMPSANAKQASIATNPVQMPQAPVPGTPPTLDLSHLTPERLMQMIGDPRMGPAIAHDQALQTLLQRSSLARLNNSLSH